MLTLPNLITLLRFPLVLAFMQDNVSFRVAALVIAMLSDGLDGFLARRYNQISRIGTFLDPLADKVLVFFVLGVLLHEHRLLPWEAATMLCRDLSVMLFGLYLACKGTLRQYQFRAIWCGKLMTALQFSVLMGLVLHSNFPPYIYCLFVVIGIMALGELYLQRSKLRVEN